MAIFIIITLSLLIAFLYSSAFYSIFLSVPSLSSRKKIVQKILEDINFSSGHKFYDLGSGSGKVIFQVAKKYPQMECIGIERDPVVCLLAKVKNILLKNKVKYIRNDFFNVDLRDADIIYAYLFPCFMEPLHQKFQRELKNGTIVISNSFPIKTKDSWKIIGEKKGTIIYVYRY